ncbi:FAD-dependent oxidoreductase [Ferruginibacter paludis]|uniref:NAD(P)/FAD-dependent oxidoreductase n=1 Tax=Ferruginibacter paludis TaxID=1310417 RepID=UPI0025B38EA7|nr:FAD-dependent oxidoreductase [Ferruginibacter paludis]MDN3657295.1 FAD-dependent oxidoreductase [Ferruginibacter paludis]
MPQLSFWEKESFFAPQDVIIVGSGFSGLWSALKLKEKNPGYKITILERGVIPTGASTRNAGFSCFGSPGELIADAMTMGEDNMWQLVEMRFKGLRQIRQYFDDAAIDYDPCGGYECFSEQSADWHECANKLDWLNSGLHTITSHENLFKIADEKITEFGFEGFTHLVENKLEAGIHSGKLVQALLQKVQGMGIQVLTNIEVKHFDKHSRGIQLHAIAGNEKMEISFYTNQLLLCTNAFTKQLLPQIDIVPNRGQVLITAPIANLKFKGTFHFDQGYYYFRNVGNRLLLGGARNKDFNNEHTLEMETTSLIQTALQDFIAQHLLPETNYTVTDTWSGIMAMGSEKKPLIQQIESDVFCCVRMSGMGVALAPEAARKIAGMMN